MQYFDIHDNMDESQNNHLEIQKADKKEHALYDSTYRKFKKIQTNSREKKTYQWLPGDGKNEWEGRIIKGHKETFRAVEYVHCF